MKLSLDRYGHSQPAVFYTDNITADKQFLEQTFPSLRQGIMPIEKHAHLSPFEIPSHIVVQVKNTASAINDDARKISDSLSSETTSISQVVVGFDTEWNVEGSTHGGVVSRGATAVIQIAHENVIYIFQVLNPLLFFICLTETTKIGQLLATKRVPHHLLLLLANPNIIKVGSMVSGDLAYLESACQPCRPFSGGVNLGKLAKERHLVPSAKCSLSDLCAAVLHKRLDKNVPERLSSQWESEILTKEQVDYAARDAYVSLILYHEILRTPIPSPIPSNPSTGLPVLVYHDDNTRLIAHGYITKLVNTNEIEGARISNVREVVRITCVVIPGAILKTHGRPLSSFGPTPFNIVVVRSHLRFSQTHHETLLSSSETVPLDTCPQLSPAPSLPFNYRCHDSELPITEESSFHHNEELEESKGSESIPIFDVLEASSSNTSVPGHSNRGAYSVDKSSVADGREILGPSPTDWPMVTRSRVLKDPFHVFKMLYIPRGHGLRFEFANALRDAIFIPNKDDRNRIETWATSLTPPTTFEKLKQTSSKTLWKHCRRIIPPPELLYPLVRQTFDTFGPLQDAHSGQPLFNKATWHASKNILSLIRDGYLSDPPDISLYTQIGIDKAFGGLPIYRCSRGTNQTEGGVHTQLRPRLPTSGASIRHVNACLLDFILRHNLLVRIANIYDLLSSHSLLGYDNRWEHSTVQANITVVTSISGSLTKSKSSWCILKKLLQMYQLSLGGSMVICTPQRQR